MSSEESSSFELLNETLELEERVYILVEELQQGVFHSPPANEDTSNEDQDQEDQASTSSYHSIMSTTSNTSTPTIDPVLSDIFGTGTSKLSDADLASSLTTHKKEDRKNLDPKALQRVKDQATKSLGVEFKVQVALGTSGVTGEENQDLETTEMAVIFAENTHVLDNIKRIVEEFDMSSAIEIRVIKDSAATHPNMKYESASIDLTQEMGVLTLDQVKEYSGDIMRWDSMSDGVHRQNLIWFLKLVRNNVSPSIAALVEPVFDELSLEHKNGAVYLKMVIDLCFTIDDHVIEALQAYIRKFGRNGLADFEGENVNKASIEILAIVKRLDQIGKLPTEAPKDILKGLQKVTHNHEFKQTFVFLTTIYSQNVVDVNHTVAMQNPVDRITAYFTQAKSLYASAVIRNKWAGKKPNKHHINNVLTNNVGSCWNCGGDHSLKDCPKPRDQATINKNRDAFYEAKRKNGGGRPKGGEAKSGDPPKSGYNRSGFGTATNGVITTADGQVYTSCKYGTSDEGCGMNKTHSSKYHSQWKANKSGYKMPSSHPFMLALATVGQCLPAAGATNNSSTNVVQSAVHQALQAFKAETVKKLGTFETQSESSDVSEAAGMLMKLFQ